MSTCLYVGNLNDFVNREIGLHAAVQYSKQTLTQLLGNGGGSLRVVTRDHLDHNA